MTGTLTFPMLLSLLSYTSVSSQFCVPDTHFTMSGRVCTCDLSGRWSEADCQATAPRCEPGLVTWLDCGRCICQENGELLCDEDSCPAHTLTKTPARRAALEGIGFRCNPFRTYYVNCSLCVCPESGLSLDAMCTKDALCIPEVQTPDMFLSSRNKSCLPQVTYLFQCLECLCSNDGILDMRKCSYTCHDQHELTPSSSNCRPGTFYKSGCNICFCLFNNNYPNGKYCTESVCDGNNSTKTSLRSIQPDGECEPHKFTDKNCLYCPCNDDGTVNSDECLQQECLWNPATDSGNLRSSCSPGEMVPRCSQCLCTADGVVNHKYCSTYCSDENKLILLETVLKDSLENSSFINKELLQIDVFDNCEPNTIYMDHGRFCICSDRGITEELCASVINREAKSSDFHRESINIDFNATCTPSTFVEFDCNTCFCSTAGKIDPDWCTNDDCEEAKAIVEKNSNKTLERDVLPDVCVSGTIFNVDCNYCICTDSGLLKDKVCTKNHCVTESTQSNDKFTCFPLSYYEVGCNVCYCPRSGVKNVAKCTTNLCDKDFLRSSVCSPGELFMDSCNVCICPPNGLKSERVCTNKTCPESLKAVNLPILQSLATNVTNIVSNLCFPGEEIRSGCRLCVCPEMGLKSYAVCTSAHCDDAEQNDDQLIKNLVTPQSNTENPMRNCTPGSKYIEGCQQCLCSLAGQQHVFCRPLPTPYCEQALETKNGVEADADPTFEDKTRNQETEPLGLDQELTRHRCSQAGRQQDDCFVCDCDQRLQVVVQEHCFRSSSPECRNAVPTFLEDNKDGF